MFVFGPKPIVIPILIWDRAKDALLLSSVPMPCCWGIAIAMAMRHKEGAGKMNKHIGLFSIGNWYYPLNQVPIMGIKGFGMAFLGLLTPVL